MNTVPKKPTPKKTATKKAAAPKAAQKCAYGDQGEVVATRDTPRGPQALCAIHKRQIELIGHKTEATS